MEDVILKQFTDELNGLLRCLHIALRINYGYCLMVCSIIKEEMQKRGIKCKIVKMQGPDAAIHYICCIGECYGYRINEYPFDNYLPVEIIHAESDEIDRIYKSQHWSLQFETEHSDIIEKVLTNFIRNYIL
jgi:hypothetical protein